jgi:hypothetical protein
MTLEDSIDGSRLTAHGAFIDRSHDRIGANRRETEDREMIPMKRLLKRVGGELLWLACACAAGAYAWMAIAAGGEENSTRAINGLPALQGVPDIPYEWRFTIMLAPYVLIVVLRLAFGHAFLRLLDRPIGALRE